MTDCDVHTKIFGFPQWLSSKKSACNAGDTGDMGFIPGSGIAPGGGNGNSPQYSCLENPIDRGTWQDIQSAGSENVKHN